MPRPAWAVLHRGGGPASAPGAAVSSPFPGEDTPATSSLADGPPHGLPEGFRTHGRRARAPVRGDTGTVIRGGNATIYVRALDQAVPFYRDVLGLTLVFQAGPHWAEFDAGGGLRLGLHPASARGPAPGTPGGITVGLAVDEPIAEVVETLRRRGVTVHGPVSDEGGLSLAFFADPDGNPLYLAETHAPGPT